MGNFEEITYPDIDKAIAIDQSPIGRTPRSNTATYTGVFSHIRELYANTSDSKERGYKAGRFSFNVSGGRCEHCAGDGIIKIEMHFLPDVYVPCEVCKGKRYNRETLQVKYKDKSIFDILDMNGKRAAVFENIPNFTQDKDIKAGGTGYKKLGNPHPPFRGEGSRVKLPPSFQRKTGKTVYILTSHYGAAHRRRGQTYKDT